MEPVTNGETIEWYKVNLNFGKISEAKFVDLSDEEQIKDKKSLKSVLKTL